MGFKKVGRHFCSVNKTKTHSFKKIIQTCSYKCQQKQILRICYCWIPETNLFWLMAELGQHLLVCGRCREKITGTLARRPTDIIEAVLMDRKKKWKKNTWPDLGEDLRLLCSLLLHWRTKPKRHMAESAPNKLWVNLHFCTRFELMTMCVSFCSLSYCLSLLWWWVGAKARLHCSLQDLALFTLFW